MMMVIGVGQIDHQQRRFDHDGDKDDGEGDYDDDDHEYYQHHRNKLVLLVKPALKGWMSWESL